MITTPNGRSNGGLECRSVSHYSIAPSLYHSISRSRARAYLMIEALVYIGVSVLLLSIGTVAMYRCMDNSVALRRNADTITTALQVGERWRADVRAASGPLKFEASPEGGDLVLSCGSHEIGYRFTDQAVFRRTDAGPWVQILTNIQSSTIESERRSTVTAWRWELELRGKPRPTKVRPLFTFFAVPGQSKTP